MSASRTIKRRGDVSGSKGPIYLSEKPLVEGFDILVSPIGKLDLRRKVFAVRLSTCFKTDGVHTIYDLVQKTEQDVLAMRHLLPWRERILANITPLLAKDGLSLGMSRDSLDNPAMHDMLGRPIGRLANPVMSVRTTCLFQHAGVRYVFELAQKTEREILGVAVFSDWGEKILEDAKAALAIHGLSLGTAFDSDTVDFLTNEVHCNMLSRLGIY